MIDLDAVGRLIDELASELDIGYEEAEDFRALVAELRACRKVVAAALEWADECGPPGGWGEKEPSKQVLWDAVEALK